MAFIWFVFYFRLIWSVLPRPGATMDFLRRSIRPKPDLYGPFWVCVTLIFSVAISGKITNIVMGTKKQSQTRFWDSVFPIILPRLYHLIIQEMLHNTCKQPFRQIQLQDFGGTTTFIR